MSTDLLTCDLSPQLTAPPTLQPTVHRLGVLLLPSRPPVPLPPHLGWNGLC